MLVLLGARNAGAVNCAITGQLLDAAGIPIANAVIQFNSIKQQTVAGTVIPPTLVTTTTDINGNIAGFGVQQGLSGQMTICNPKSGCGTPTPSLIPVATTANFADILAGTALSTGSGTFGNMIVTGTSSFGGTMTFPDGSTYDTNGHENMKALGIGDTAPTSGASPGGLLQATRNGNFSTTIDLKNTFAGPNSQTVLYFNNDKSASTSSYGAIGLTSSLFTLGGPLAPGDSFDILTGSSGGIVISSGASNSPPIYFDVGGVQAMELARINGGNTVYIQNSGTSSMFFGGSTTQPIGTITALPSTTNQTLTLNSGAHDSGSNWIADAANVSSVDLNGANTSIFSGTGNTVGNPVSNVMIAQFVHNPPQISGLQLGGYAGPINGSYGIPGIMIANSYISGSNWANINISGASYINSAATGWTADGGAGSGLSLFQMNETTGEMWWSGGVGAGAAVAWNPTFNWGPEGLEVTHIENNQGYGVPSCSNCIALASGSRDTAGYIQVSGNWPITLNFAKAFDGSAICVGNSLAGPPNEGVVSFAGNSTTSIQIYCRLPGGAVCSGQTAWISYHCFGYGQ